jgi:hypothetical protein
MPSTDRRASDTVAPPLIASHTVASAPLVSSSAAPLITSDTWLSIAAFSAVIMSLSDHCGSIVTSSFAHMNSS